MQNTNEAMPTAKRGGHTVKNDVIFILALLVTVSILGLIYYLIGGEGDKVIVTVGGEFYAEYSLSDDITVEIKTDIGSNTLLISNGEARITDASCPDGICEGHKPVSRSGESIVCLPNKVVVTVEKTATDDPDLVIGG